MSFLQGLHGTIAVLLLCALLFVDEAGVPLITSLGVDAPEAAEPPLAIDPECSSADGCRSIG